MVVVVMGGGGGGGGASKLCFRCQNYFLNSAGGTQHPEGDPDFLQPTALDIF